MALDLLHAEAVTDTEPGGLVTSGGTGSILHAMLAYREHAAADARHRRGPTSSSPRPAHPAFDKACHLFGIELRTRAGRPRDHDWSTSTGWPATSTTRRSPSSARPATTATAPSTRSPSWRRSPSSAASACTSTAASAGSSSRSARSSATTSRCSTSACPGVTSISADTHKYGYAFKGTLDPAVPRQGAAQRAVLLPHRLERRQVLLAGHRGLALRRAARRDLGRDGAARPRGLPRATRGEIFETADRDAGRRSASTPSCGCIGEPTFLFSFTSDEFDIYHVNDFMRPQGWRFNGQQYPNAIHMAVTRPADPARRGRGVRRRPRRGRRLRQGEARSRRGRRRRARSTAAWPAG